MYRVMAAYGSFHKGRITRASGVILMRILFHYAETSALLEHINTPEAELIRTIHKWATERNTVGHKVYRALKLKLEPYANRPLSELEPFYIAPEKDEAVNEAQFWAYIIDIVAMCNGILKARYFESPSDAGTQANVCTVAKSVAYTMGSMVNPDLVGPENVVETGKKEEDAKEATLRDLQKGLEHPSVYVKMYLEDKAKATDSGEKFDRGGGRGGSGGRGAGRGGFGGNTDHTPNQGRGFGGGGRGPHYGLECRNCGKPHHIAKNCRAVGGGAHQAGDNAGGGRGQGGDGRGRGNNSDRGGRGRGGDGGGRGGGGGGNKADSGGDSKTDNGSTPAKNAS